MAGETGMKIDDQLHNRRDPRRIGRAVVEPRCRRRPRRRARPSNPSARGRRPEVTGQAHSKSTAGSHRRATSSLARANSGERRFTTTERVAGGDLEPKAMDRFLERLVQEEPGVAVRPGDELARVLDYLGWKKPAARTERRSIRARARASPTAPERRRCCDRRPSPAPAARSSSAAHVRSGCSYVCRASTPSSGRECGRSMLAQWTVASSRKPLPTKTSSCNSSSSRRPTYSENVER